MRSQLRPAAAHARQLEGYDATESIASRGPTFALLSDLEGHVGQLVRFGDRLISDLPVHHINTTGQCRLFFENSVRSRFGQKFYILCGDVSQSLSSRSGVSTRHIRDTVMDDILFHVGQLLMSSRT